MVARKLLVLTILGVVSTTAFAQYPYTLTGFEEYGDGESVLFRSPLWSGTTISYDQTDPLVEPDGIWGTDPDDPNPPWSITQVQSVAAQSGSKALETYFMWGNPADTDDPPGYVGDPYTGENDFIRCTTYVAPNLDRPSLHLGGKLKFKIAVLGYSDENYTPAAGSSLLVTLGIRETGMDLPQGMRDIAGGDIEWLYPGPGQIPADTNGPLPEPTYPGGWRINATFAYPPAPEDWHDVVIDLTNPHALRGFADNGDSIITCGDGVLDATAVGDGVNRGALEHLGFTNDPTDTVGKFFFVYIDEIQFEAPVVDPTLPPSVVSPIIVDDTEVTVTNLHPDVSNVKLFKNDIELASQNVTNDFDVTFTIAAAVENDVYTATQTVNGIESAPSEAVTVYPAPSPFTFATIIDETGGGSCAADEWEWVGAYSTSGSLAAAQGHPLFANSAVWQTVDIPFDDPDQIHPSLGGNGELAPSPTGFYTFDTWWWTITPGATADMLGPWEVFVDAVQEIDSNGIPSTVIMNMENLELTRLTRQRGQSTVAPLSTGASTLAAYDGLQSYRVTWEYGSASDDQTLGMLERLGYTCNTSVPFNDSVNAIRFRMLIREPATNPDCPLPEVVGPIVAGGNGEEQDTIRVNNAAGATSVQLLVNGQPFGSPVVPTGTETDFTGITLNPGDSISATQEACTNGLPSDPAYPKVVAAKPVPPILEGIIMPAAPTVTVTGVSITPFASASYVAVYANGAYRGYAIPTEGQETIDVPITGGTLVKGDVITATQFVNGVESDPSNAIEVNFGSPSIYIVPAQGDSTVRVFDVFDGADEVRIVNSNGFVHGTYAPSGGETDVLIPVTGLVAGQQIYTDQSVTVGGDVVTSPASIMETVTGSVTTTVLCDDFEYASQSAFQSSAWTNGDYDWLTLSTAQNSTPDGTKSLLSPAATTEDFRIEQPLAEEITGTAEEPLVWSVAIFDAGGPGSEDNQWADLINTATDWLLLEVGMCTPGFDPKLDNDYYSLRINGKGGPNWIPMNAIAGSPMRSIGWHTFTIVVKGTYVDAYVDGILTNKNIELTGTGNLALARIGTIYGAAADAWYDDYCIKTGKVAFADVEPQPPAAPTVVAPVEEGDEEVMVGDIATDATLVSVYANDSLIGSINPAGTNGIAVPVTALVKFDMITATATNTVGESFASAPVEVGSGNGDLLISLGVRDGNDEIEWVGASEAINGAPQGSLISVSEEWQTITFDPTTDSIVGFTGDGVIDGTAGILEHLAVAVPATSPDRSSGTWHLFVDNVRNVGATPELISDFEGYELYSDVMFQAPGYSGSTGADLTGFNYSSNRPIGNPGSSQLLSWFWKDTTDQRWARITTSGTANLPAPAIDLTKPIQMDILLHPAGDDVGPDPVDVVDAFSMANHGTAGDLGIQIYPVPLVFGQPFNTESRFGLTQNILEINLSDVITDASGITVTANNGTEYTAVVTLDPAGDKLIATFPLLPNQYNYTVSVSGAVVNDMTFEYVVLTGNTVNIGSMNLVDTTDRTLLNTKLGQGADITNTQYDIFRIGASNGVIDTTDRVILNTKLGQGLLN